VVARRPQREDLRANARQVAARRVHRHAVGEPRDDEHPERATPLRLGELEHRPDVRPHPRQVADLGREDADDGVRGAIHSERLTHRRGVAAEGPRGEGVGDERHRGRADALVGRFEVAPARRANAERPEEAGGDAAGPHALRVAACGFIRARRLHGRVATASTSGLQGLYKPVAGESDSGCNGREPEVRNDVGHVEGNYQAYTEDLKRRKGPDADQPQRIADKKLVRA